MFEAFVVSVVAEVASAVPPSVIASASSVPSTSTSPDISRLVNTDVPTAVILSLNVAAPAALISSVRAVIDEPPSLPENIISLSDIDEWIPKLLDELNNTPKFVPSLSSLI